MFVGLPPMQRNATIVTAVQRRCWKLKTSPFTRQNARSRLVREFRTRLIADVVAGKLDVREAAAGLPEKIEEAEPPDPALKKGKKNPISTPR